MATEPPKTGSPAERLYQLGLECEHAGDLKGARLQYRLALQLEPQSEIIQKALIRLDENPVRPAPLTQPLYAREHPRHAFHKMVKVSCATWGHFINFYGRNLSQGGLFVRSDAPLEMGTQVRVRLHLPDGKALELISEVVRTVTVQNRGPGEVPGIGLRFLEMAPETSALLKTLLEDAKATHKPPSQTEATPTSVPPAPSEPYHPKLARPLSVGDLFDNEALAGLDDNQGSKVIDEVESVLEGRALLIAGKYAEAREKLAKALEAQPKDRHLQAAYHLASGYEAKQANRKEEAKKHFETVLLFDKYCQEAIAELRTEHTDPPKFDGLTNVFTRIFSRKDQK